MDKGSVTGSGLHLELCYTLCLAPECFYFTIINNTVVSE